VKRIGLVVHPRRALDGPLARLHAWSQAEGVEMVQVPMEGVDRVVAEPGDAKTCDVIVALGGDGTTLAALRAGARARQRSPTTSRTRCGASRPASGTAAACRP
jgi:NAD+ kinase